MNEKYREIVQEVFDSHPDEEPLLEYDDFLVGGAISRELPDFAATQRSLEWQLTGVSNVDSLKQGEVEQKNVIETEDDLDLFISERVDLLDEQQYDDLFLAMKLRAFKIFDFLDIRSATLGDIPIKEKDLVLDEDDYYILDYLKGAVKDYYAVASLATLLAFENMGIHTVKFQQQDECPICRALDGSVFETRNLIGLFGDGNHVSHPYCDCQLVPIIWREMYEGPLVGHLDKEEVLHRGTRIIKLPLELELEIRRLSEGLHVESIEFVDMKDHLRENLDIDFEGIVAILQDDVLMIHNSYVGPHGPADFLREFSRSKAFPAKISTANLENGEVYLLAGRRVVKWDGKYWDPETGELLK